MGCPSAGGTVRRAEDKEDWLWSLLPISTRVLVLPQGGGPVPHPLLLGAHRRGKL